MQAFRKIFEAAGLCEMSVASSTNLRRCSPQDSGLLKMEEKIRNCFMIIHCFTERCGLLKMELLDFSEMWEASLRKCTTL
jgi:hypothetical protein